MHIRIVFGFVVFLFVACADNARPPRDHTLTVYAYSALHEVLDNGLIAAFQKRWEDQTGGHVTIIRKFGGSRDLVSRILDGTSPQVAILASEMDANLLVPDVVRPEAWTALPHQGILATSPLVLHVREGNPKGIRDFESLVSSDAVVLRSTPKTSGLGASALLAAYGEGLSRTGNPKEAMGLAIRFQISSLCPAASARAASRCFRHGIGDVCIAYEHNVLATPSRPRKPGDVVRPPQTLLCEPIVVVLRRNSTPEEQEVLDALVGFLWSPEARAILEKHGLHAPDREGAEFGLPDAMTLKDLGGSEKAVREILAPLLKDAAER